MVCGADFRSPTEKIALEYGRQLAIRGHLVTIAINGDPGSLEDELGGAAPEGLSLLPYKFLGPWLSTGGERAPAVDVVHAYNPRLNVISATRRFVGQAALVIHFEDDEWGLAHGGSATPLRRLARFAARCAGPAYPPLWRFATPRTMDWVAQNADSLEAITPALARRVEGELGRVCEVLLPAHPALGGPKPSAEPPPLPKSATSRPIIAFTGAVFAAHAADFRLLLAAMGELQQRGVDAILVHSGKAAPRFDLSAWALEAGMAPDTLLGLGYLSPGQLRGLLEAATVLVQPGAPSEFNRLRLPSKLQTYLDSGTPVITFGCGAGELLEDRREVLKTTTAEPSELADRIVEVVSDARLRATLSAGGPAAAERLFDPESNTKVLLGIYSRAIEGGVQAMKADEAGAFPLYGPAPLDAQDAAYEQAVLSARADPEMRDVVLDSFLQEDLAEALDSFMASEHWARIQRHLRRLDVPAGARVLDFGGGRGLVAAALSRSGYRATLCEPNPSDVCGSGAALRLSEMLDGGFTVEASSLDELAPGDGFDAVVCRAVLHHVKPLTGVLRQLLDVLQPGAPLIASDEPTIREPRELEILRREHPFVRYGVDEWATTSSEYAAALREAGFENIRVSFPVSFSDYRDVVRSDLSLALATAAYARYRAWAILRPRPGESRTILARRPRDKPRR